MGQVICADAFATRVVSRSDVRVEARISVADRPRAITLINLSSHGFMGECPAGVPLRSQVTLDLPGLGPLSACVRWAVGRKVGGRFATPLNDVELADALAAAFPPSFSPSFPPSFPAPSPVFHGSGDNVVRL